MAFLAPALPFIMAATAVAGTVMTYRGQKEAEKAQEDAARHQAETARRQELAAEEANRLAEENARMAELEAENEAMILAGNQAEEASRRRAIAAASGVGGSSIDTWLKGQEDLEAANLDYLARTGASEAAAHRQSGRVALAEGRAGATGTRAAAAGTRAQAGLTGSRAIGTAIKGVGQVGTAFRAGKDWWDQSDYSMGTPSPSGPYDGSAGYGMGNM